jgi:hypothetical protein
MIQWAPGKDSNGRIPKGDDGKPLYERSRCGRYTVSRAYTDRGWLSDAWLIRERDVALLLAGGVSEEEAKQAVEDHANGRTG